MSSKKNKKPNKKPAVTRNGGIDSLASNQEKNGSTQFSHPILSYRKLVGHEKLLANLARQGFSYTDCQKALSMTQDEINDYLHERMKINGDYTTVSGEDVFDVNILANVVTIKVDVKLTNSYQIDFTVSTLNELLGINSAIYNADVSSQNKVDITRGVNNLLILVI